MSAWNEEASTRLSELEYLIGHLNFVSPMMLWIELRMRFDQLCEETPRDLDLLRRIWGYAQWCMSQPSPDVRTAVVAAFCEHLLESPKVCLPEIIAKSDLMELKPVLLHHGSEEVFESVCRGFR